MGSPSSRVWFHTSISVQAEWATLAFSNEQRRPLVSRVELRNGVFLSTEEIVYLRKAARSPPDTAILGLIVR